jgi:hypothetical protein
MTITKIGYARCSTDKQDLTAQRHSRRDPTLASAAVMRMTVIQTQTERKRQDRSIRRAEKHRRRTRTWRLRGLIRPVPAACATEDAGWGEKSLSSGQNQVILASDGRLLGESQLMASNGGMMGVHQIRFWWNDRSGLEIEEADFVKAQPDTLTQNRLDAVIRSELIRAFEANAPDVRSCSSGKAKSAIIGEYLRGKRWQKIYRAIMEQRGL